MSKLTGEQAAGIRARAEAVDGVCMAIDKRDVLALCDDLAATAAEASASDAALAALAEIIWAAAPDCVPPEGGASRYESTSDKLKRIVAALAAVTAERDEAVGALASRTTQRDELGRRLAESEEAFRRLESGVMDERMAAEHDLAAERAARQAAERRAEVAVTWIRAYHDASGTTPSPLLAAALGAEPEAPAQAMSAEAAAEVVRFAALVLHGDEKHRAWLRAAAENYTKTREVVAHGGEAEGGR